MRFSASFAVSLIALAATVPACAQGERWSRIEESPSQEIEWKKAPPALRKKFLAFRKSSKHCWEHEEEDWSVPSPDLVVWNLKGDARAVFQVCNLSGGGARTITYIVMIARKTDFSDAAPAKLAYHNSGNRKVITTSVIENPSFDLKGGGLAANEYLDTRRDACQQRHEWKWTGTGFSLVAIRAWRKCDEE